MIRVDPGIQAADLGTRIEELWRLSADKILDIERHYDFSAGAPVFTVDGRYATRGWTEWTLGFHYGSALLQFDATGDSRFLELGRSGSVEKMIDHLTHMGVHDHGFNIVSTFGNLLRLVEEDRIPASSWERRYYQTALRVSAAVQARRWTEVADGGFIHSFNGPHSLFADTIRSLRSLALGHTLGHHLMEEGDRRVSLLERLVRHAQTTARYAVYYGKGRDAYDVRGRVAHESVFNTRDGSYRSPGSQQGYSARSTWTRGLAWILLGFAEQLEYLEIVDGAELEPFGGADAVGSEMLAAVRAAADFYLERSPPDGIPYWDSAAPGLDAAGAHLERRADPFNAPEPVDSSAAAIAAQGLLRLGRYLEERGDAESGGRYWRAGLTVCARLFEDPYLSRGTEHQGLILHSVYHRPNGWDHVPPGRPVPCGESSMWGDYHAREAALYVQRIVRGEPYLTFWRGGRNQP
jgi:unsaturated chondroitin disaccharide hydrolase